MRRGGGGGGRGPTDAALLVTAGDGAGRGTTDGSGLGGAGRRGSGRGGSDLVAAGSAGARLRFARLRGGGGGIDWLDPDLGRGRTGAGFLESELSAAMTLAPAR